MGTTWGQTGRSPIFRLSKAQPRWLGVDLCDPTSGGDNRGTSRLSPCFRRPLFPESRMRVRGFLITFALVHLMIASALGQLRVDATGPIRARKTEPMRSSGGGTGRKVPLQIAIEVSVSVPDRNGRTLVEFILTNSGDKDLTLPISPNSGDFEPSDPKTSYTVMALGLRVSLSKKPGIVFQGGADLYGSVAVPASLARIAPGDSIRVLTRVALPTSGQAKLVATAFADNETLRVSDGELILDSQEIGFASSREYTTDSLVRSRE